MNDGEYQLTQADYDRWQRASVGTFWDHMGCEIEDVSFKKVVISLLVERHHLNLIGIVHGGVHAMLLDSAMGLLAMITRPSADVVTVNLNVNYVASMGEGKVIVTAEPVHSSRKLVTVQAYARGENGDLLAFGTGTFRVLDRKAEWQTDGMNKGDAAAGNTDNDPIGGGVSDGKH